MFDDNWKRIFSEFGTKPLDACPFRKDIRPILSPLNIEDVSAIIAKDDGENDGPEWVGVFSMKDGRFAVLIAGCDYTGWDCYCEGRSFVANTLDEIVQYGLSQEERERLGASYRLR